MKKKNKIIIFIIISLIMAGIIIGAGLTYIVKIGLPYIRHESMLKTDTDLLCLTLSVAHGCNNENYNEEELKKFLKEKVLTKISLKEAEEIIFEKKQSVVIERANMSETDLFVAEKEREIQKKQCEDAKKYAEIKARKAGYSSKNYTCRGGSGLDYIVYLNKTLSIIQKLKQEGFK